MPAEFDSANNYPSLSEKSVGVNLFVQFHLFFTKERQQTVRPFVINSDFWEILILAVYSFMIHRLASMAVAAIYYGTLAESECCNQLYFLKNQPTSSDKSIW